MYVLTVALRYLRSRPMTYVAAAIVTLIVVLYLLIISVMEGFKELYMDKLQSIQAHLTVRIGNDPAGIVRPNAWAAALEKVPGIRAATVGIEIPVLAMFNEGRTVGSLRGVDLARELQHGRLKEILQPKEIAEFGEFDVRGKKLRGCIVGGYWRRMYSLAVGQHVTFLFTDEDGDPRALAFRVVGFFEGQNEMYENAAYVDRRFLAAQLGTPEAAKTLSLWVEGNPDRPDLPEIQAAVRARMLGLFQAEVPEYPVFPQHLVVESWREKDSNLYQAVTRENLIMRFIMGVFLVFSAIIVMLILGRLAAEKVRDIGALRAVGASPAGIQGLFLAQGLTIALVGLALGLPIALGFIAHVNEVEQFVHEVLYRLCQVNFRVFPSSSFLVDRIPTKVLPGDVALISVMTLCAGVLGAALPAWRAARMNPVECLRHE